MEPILGMLAATAGNAILTGLNNRAAGQIAKENMAENYHYNEMAAQAADDRTRALYKDFYSPQALIKQYKAAGLSPSLMFGGTPGQGGMSGAQGSGAAGQSRAYMPMSMIESAQAAKLLAQIEKTKAETENIKADTKKINLSNDYQEMANILFKDEFRILQTGYTDSEGNQTSLFEMANNSEDLEAFIKRIREASGYGSKESEQKVLRSIYMNSNRFERDIEVLAYEGENATFQKNLIKMLSKEGYAEQNAETALKELRAAGEMAELTESQKGAFNNIIERLKKRNSTAADIAIVATMLLGKSNLNFKKP